MGEMAVMAVERCFLVLLFLPFSALDKVLNFDAAVTQARQTFHVRWLSIIAIGAGFAVELLMSLAVLCGRYDRFAALILAAYCIVTALLWKQFWTRSDFRLKGASQGRETFWDFLKNIAVAGGFLLLAFGTTPAELHRFLANPLVSSHPYDIKG